MLNCSKNFWHFIWCCLFENYEMSYYHAQVLHTAKHLVINSNPIFLLLNKLAQSHFMLYINSLFIQLLQIAYGTAIVIFRAISRWSLISRNMPSLKKIQIVHWHPYRTQTAYFAFIFSFLLHSVILYLKHFWISSI